MIKTSDSTLKWPAMSFGVKSPNFQRHLCLSHQNIVHLLILKCVTGRNCNCSYLSTCPLWFGCQWGHCDVCFSQNIQHDPVLHPVTCSWGTRVPSLEVVSVRTCWYKKIAMYLVTAWRLRIQPKGCPETSFATNLLRPESEEWRSKIIQLYRIVKMVCIVLRVIWFLHFIHCLMFQTKHNILETCSLSVLRKKVGVGRKWYSYALLWQTQLRMHLVTEDSSLLCCDGVFLVRGSWCFQGMWCLHSQGTSIARIQIVLLNHSCWIVSVLIYLITWAWEQIQFLKHYILFGILNVDQVHKPSNPEYHICHLQNHLRFDINNLLCYRSSGLWSVWHLWHIAVSTY
jgi:hypothetical protein